MNMLPFFQWRARLCPHGANLASCFGCRNFLGINPKNWPGGMCGKYSADAWRLQLRIATLTTCKN